MSCITPFSTDSILQKLFGFEQHQQQQHSGSKHKWLAVASVVPLQNNPNQEGSDGATCTFLCFSCAAYIFWQPTHDSLMQKVCRVSFACQCIIDAWWDICWLLDTPSGMHLAVLPTQPSIVSMSNLWSVALGSSILIFTSSAGRYSGERVAFRLSRPGSISFALLCAGHSVWSLSCHHIPLTYQDASV